MEIVFNGIFSNNVDLFLQMDQFVLTQTQVAMVIDALASSHPLSVEVNDTDEINLLFDSISYQKVVTVMHIMHKSDVQRENGKTML